MAAPDQQSHAVHTNHAVQTPAGSAACRSPPSLAAQVGAPSSEVALTRRARRLRYALLHRALPASSRP
eukprot:5188571-Prymnesium_polylepis.1